MIIEDHLTVRGRTRRVHGRTSFLVVGSKTPRGVFKSQVRLWIVESVGRTCNPEHWAELGRRSAELGDIRIVPERHLIVELIGAPLAQLGNCKVRKISAIADLE